MCLSIVVILYPVIATRATDEACNTGSDEKNHMHYADVIMTKMASQITSLTVVYSTVYSDADQIKHQSSASLAFVWGIHRDRWIPRTKGQLRGKCFHLMTSSWPMDCLVSHVMHSRVMRHVDMETLSTLLAFCEENPLVPQSCGLPS